MNKNSLSEQEIRSQYIRPALVNAGWQGQDVRIREEFHLSQSKTGDFKHFGDKMTWVQNREVNKAFQIYLALYQAVSGIEEEMNIYKQFSPDFFDLVIGDHTMLRELNVSLLRTILDKSLQRR